MSSFFPSPFLLGQTDVSPTRCWGKNLLLFTDTSAHFEAMNRFAQVTQQKHSSSWLRIPMLQEFEPKISLNETFVFKERFWVIYGVYRETGLGIGLGFRIRNWKYSFCLSDWYVFTIPKQLKAEFGNTFRKCFENFWTFASLSFLLAILFHH